MNVVKYRPVGRPSAEVIRVRVTQRKRAPYTSHLAYVDRVMLRRGFVRAGIRHKL
jgi:hypothetical protein